MLHKLTITMVIVSVSSTWWGQRGKRTVQMYYCRVLHKLTVTTVIVSVSSTWWAGEEKDSQDVLLLSASQVNSHHSHRSSVIHLMGQEKKRTVQMYCCWVLHKLTITKVIVSVSSTWWGQRRKGQSRCTQLQQDNCFLTLNHHMIVTSGWPTLIPACPTRTHFFFFLTRVILTRQTL